MPPTNTCDPSCDTDEDSGTEDQVTINNLPGNQLPAQAFLVQEDPDAEEWEEEDLIPLAQLLKKPDIVLKPNKSYRWVNGTLEHDLLDIQWPQISTVNSSNSPLELFELFFDTDFIQMFVDCTTKYASSKNRKADVTVQK